MEEILNKTEKDEKSNKILFGTFNIPYKFENKGIKISIKKEGDLLIYNRKYQNEDIEKILLQKEGKIIINPVEPLNLPKVITKYFLIELERMIIIEPKNSTDLFISCPIDIGIFISEKGNFKIIDIFTFVKKKYTLYGDPQNGVICRYWKSDINLKQPVKNFNQYGIMKLKVTNTTGDWAEIKNIVFNANGMKIYYNNEFISINAKLKILGKLKGETEFIDSPIEKKMTRSHELFKPKQGVLVAKKFHMEDGF